ncbi:RES family NAD+ phosphorylase [Streptomyces sp. NPDC005813]|uniref:RES family NAD+ phosphorylase n=1 Tax=Streptomyces sp. NPDC005813 TaxID=3155592 RepID=UPI0033E14C3B
MTSDFPPDDPKELAGFPTADIQFSYFRVHRAVNDARYFGANGLGRYDDPRGPEGQFGTCYLAGTEAGAFLETLSGFRPLPEDLVNERRMSELRVDPSGPIADVTHESVVGDYGIFGDLSADGGRQLTQQWALAFWQAGFGGVQYRAHHHPGFSEQALALFGPPGVQSADGTDGPVLLEYLKPEPEGGPEPISDGLLQEMEERFRIFVIPSAPLPF